MTVTCGSVIYSGLCGGSVRLRAGAEGQGPPLSGCVLSYFTQEVIGLLEMSKVHGLPLVTAELGGRRRFLGSA